MIYKLSIVHTRHNMGFFHHPHPLTLPPSLQSRTRYGQSSLPNNHQSQCVPLGTEDKVTHSQNEEYHRTSLSLHVPSWQTY